MCTKINYFTLDPEKKHFLCTKCSAVIYLHPCSHSLSTLLILHIHSSQWLCSSAFPTLWLPVFHGSTDVAPDTLWWLRGLCSFMLPTSCSSRSFAAPSVQVLWLPELCCSTGLALWLRWCSHWLPELCSSTGAATDSLSFAAPLALQW